MIFHHPIIRFSLRTILWLYVVLLLALLWWWWLVKQSHKKSRACTALREPFATVGGSGQNTVSAVTEASVTQEISVLDALLAQKKIPCQNKRVIINQGKAIPANQMCVKVTSEAGTPLVDEPIQKIQLCINEAYPLVETIACNGAYGQTKLHKQIAAS